MSAPGPPQVPVLSELTAEDVSSLRPYVINLTQGKFSDDGAYSTTPTHVDDIFTKHLPDFIEATGERRTPVVVWAHGGLIDEAKGLAIARSQIDWWLANGVYPIHFVWESGLLDALRLIVKDYLSARDILSAGDLADYISDPAIEHLARPIGSRLWLAMKQSAQLASAAEGGARYTAEKLAEFVETRRDTVTLHAVGHSAGSIFHSHFIPAALHAGVGSFATANLLAPAINIEDFTANLSGLIGSERGIAQLAVFTMRRKLERADNCMRVYQKSLLYLISRALESRRGVPILGLEDSLRAAPAMRELFGITERPPRRAGVALPSAELIWSESADGPDGCRTTSISHGGFDNDKATMESVAFRILHANDQNFPGQVVPFPADLEDGARALWSDASALRPGIAPTSGSCAAVNVVATQPATPSIGQNG
jgi:hypothetical protein